MILLLLLLFSTYLISDSLVHQGHRITKLGEIKADFNRNVNIVSSPHKILYIRRNTLMSSAVSIDGKSESVKPDTAIFYKANQATIDWEKTTKISITQQLNSFQPDFDILEQTRLSPSLRRQLFISRIVSWALSKLIRQKTEYVTGLDMDVQASSNRAILKGKIDTLDMQFSKISFANLFVSGGGRIIMKGLDLKMRRFLFQNKQSVRRPYTLYTDLVLTQEDIINSKLIRNLMQLLVNTILERAFLAKSIVSASIRKVNINARRLYAQGTVKLLSEDPKDVGLASVDFEVSTSASMRDKGQVLFLKDIQLAVNPDSILRTAISIPTVTPIDVDLGEDCRIQNFVIANRSIWIRGAAVISPVTPFAVTADEKGKKALYKYDLAALLSSLLRLNGGIAVRWAQSLS